MTPLMKQYRRIKSQYPDALLLFRMGDFFETFEEDAITAAKVLGITLTKRANGAAAEVPLAGFPHHALDSYLPKLVRAGYRVAVCEQLEDPKFAKGIVKRDVVEVVTPGVVFTDKILEHKKNHYLAAIAFGKEHAGMAFVDASTGDFFAAEIPYRVLRDQLEALNPREILLKREDEERWNELIGKYPLSAVLTKIDDWVFTRDVGYELLALHFRTQTLKGFGIDDLHEGIIAAGVAMHYLKETQKANLPHIRSIRRFFAEDYITLDAATRRNLEITVSMSGEGREGTLISILDKTRTSMGGRLFKSWITHPLKRVDEIRFRQQGVKDLADHPEQLEIVARLLDETADFERLIARVCTGRVTPRELLNLGGSCRRLPMIKKALGFAAAPVLVSLVEQMEDLEDVADLIDTVIADDPPASVGDGRTIRAGFHAELDEIRDIALHGREWLEEYKTRLRKETGITSLKVSYNKVFGYYIEVSKANIDRVPDGFIRKQTLVNAERYITEELKSFEERVLTAKEQIAVLESELFNELRLSIADHTERIQKVARAVAVLDCLVGLALAAIEHRYTCPEIDDSDSIEITAGRHPVVERLLPPGERFIPNDVHLDSTRQIMIITGPNMSGKSTYLRMAGLIVLLAQVGSFVPAAKARIGVVDRIFTRVGASDNIAAGESTFLIEMQEAANILNNATPASLVLLDEVGRGTSTFDGISIAWAITEYLHEAPLVRAKTMFATHYHELNEMAEIFPRIHNYKVEVKEYGDKVIFLRQVSPGTADHSYGIQVGQMAGLPDSVTRRAKEILRTLEGQDLTVLADSIDEEGKVRIRAQRGHPFQISLFEATETELKDRVAQLNLDDLTPIQALQLLHELQKLARGS